MATYKNIFKITHNNLTPTPGNVLISEPFLKDVYFQRSVVLLVEHDREGSMGFVLNKKTELVVNTFFDELKDLPEMPIFLGGPVCSNKLFFLHSLGEEVIPGSKRINDRLYFDGDFDILKQYIINGGDVKGKVKFFLGYSGWTDGQLTNEIDHNSWMVGNATNRNVMQAEGESFWKLSLELLGGRYKTWINFPKDPCMN